MTIEKIQCLLRQASAATGTNVSLGIYANGNMYIDGHDCQAAGRNPIEDAVDWLQKLASDHPAPKLERKRRTTYMPSRAAAPVA